jgi:hypothetical protein
MELSLSQDYCVKAAERAANAIMFDEDGLKIKAKESYVNAIEFLKLAKIQCGEDEAFAHLVRHIDFQMFDYNERVIVLEQDIEKHGVFRPKVPSAFMPISSKPPPLFSRLLPYVTLINEFENMPFVYVPMARLVWLHLS